jgi:zinc D-Ala-D-Ala dipeptidase
MRTTKQGTPEPFAALNKIPIVDNLEPLVDIRVFCRRLIVNQRVLPYVRLNVAKMLNEAQAMLPPGHHLRINSGLRTLEGQAEMYWRHYRDLEKKHPNWPKSALRRTNNKYFAAPDVAAPPGHTTGGAVDLTVIGPDRRVLDMTSPTVGWEGAYTYSTKLSKEAYLNRRMLIDIMFAVGFSNCRDEWWHWSYGDNAWAVRTGNKVACYGLIVPPPSHTHAGPMRPNRLIVRRSQSFAKSSRFAAHRRPRVVRRRTSG